MADARDASYTNAHRAFLQALLARQTFTFEDARPLIAAIETTQTPARPTLVEDISQEDFDHYIHALNSTISPFDLEIRSSLDQKTRARLYALVNTTSDALTQMATLYSADELAFVRRLLDAMFDTYNTPQAEIMAVTSMQALHLAKSPAQASQTQAHATSSDLTKTQAQNILEQMVESGWLDHSSLGYYSLAPRALMELRGWLVDTYGDDDDDDGDGDGYARIKFCQACRDVVTVGQRCPDRNCLARIHDHCVRNIFRAQQNREECPLCQAPWASPLHVGELAARAPSRQAAPGSQRRPAADADDDED